MERAPLLVAMSIALALLTSHAVAGSLDEARSLVYEDRFIHAYLALTPLLTSHEPSDAQEEALWLAERLCAGIAAQLRLPTRYEAEHGAPRGRPPSAARMATTTHRMGRREPAEPPRGRLPLV